MMNGYQSSLILARSTRRADICSCFTALSISSSRSFSAATARHGIPTIHTERGKDVQASQASRGAAAIIGSADKVAAPAYKDLTPVQRAAQAAERARTKLQSQQQRFAEKQRLGGLAEDNVFHDEEMDSPEQSQNVARAIPLNKRNLEQMALVLNPNPIARARWHSKMVIRHVRRRGRLPRAVQIARTEREHLAKSHFFKTSMKKLAPLARQIAGKPIEEAILQMRFSKKKAAIEVRKHLIQARNEAIVIRGLGLPSAGEVIEGAEQTTPDGPVQTDPSITPAAPHQHPTKTRKPGVAARETDIYVAQAWVGRGPYTPEPEYRARGRVNLLRHPVTSVSILLKEEKTRFREKAEKEEKAIKKRLGKQMWTQLPDRPVTKQSQYVLW